MIQLTIIDAIAFGFIISFWSCAIGMFVVIKYQLQPLLGQFKSLAKMFLEHLEQDTEMLKEIDAIKKEFPIKSPIQFKK